MITNSLNIFVIIWHSGLVVKLVLLMLLTASIISWSVIIKKWKYFKKLKIENDIFMQLFTSSANMKEVSQKSETLQLSSYKLLFHHGYGELNKMRVAIQEHNNLTLKDHFKEFGFGVLDRAIERSYVEAALRAESSLSLLASIGSISPFIGLFGTVWGIIDSFNGLASGGATLDVVAPGIAEALVATAVGLAAAIPAVLFYNYFSSNCQKIVKELEAFSGQFLNIVERSLLK